MKKIKFIAAVIVGLQLFLLAPAMAGPLVRHEIQKGVIGHHEMQRGESREDGLREAKKEALRVASELAGTSLDARTTTRNGEVIEDTIRLRTGSVVKIVDGYVMENQECEHPYIDYIADIEVSLPGEQPIQDLPQNLGVKAYIYLPEQELKVLKNDNPILPETVKYDKDMHRFSFLAIDDLSDSVQPFLASDVPETGMVVCQYEVDSDSRIVYLPFVVYKDQYGKARKKNLNYSRYIVPGTVDGDRWVAACLQSRYKPDTLFRNSNWQYIPGTGIYIDTANSFENEDGNVILLMVYTGSSETFDTLSAVEGKMANGKLYAINCMDADLICEWHCLKHEPWTKNNERKILDFVKNKKFQHI